MITDGMRVLSVDDNDTNLKIIEIHCKHIKIEVDSCSHPSDALKKFAKDKYDIVITDYMMPDIDGIQLIEEIRKKDETVPIIMVTAVGDDSGLHLKALENGASDFLIKPINSSIFKARISNLLQLRKALKMIEERAIHLEEEVKKATAEITDREHETLRLLGNTAEFKDPETGKHVSRVAGYSKILAKAYGLDEKMQEIIYHASPFHDIGKVAIPDRILLKPSKLTEEEMEEMRKHPEIGYDILKNSKSEYLKAGGVIASTHHEKYDGTGYPKGLKGESIPIMGRIVAVSDVFDALTSKRPYKDAWSFDRAVGYIKDQSGKHFDPDLTKILLDNIDKIKEIYSTLKE